MKDFVILSDSCCDLNKEMRERFGIDYVPMRIIYGETDIPASLDWEQISFKQFYDMMRDGVRKDCDDYRRRIQGRIHKIPRRGQGRNVHSLLVGAFKFL